MNVKAPRPPRLPVRNLGLAWHELTCRLGRRGRCARLSSILARRDGPIDDVCRSLDRIVRSTSGRALSPFVMGDHARWQSLTDLLDRGAAQAAHLLPHMQSHEVVLEYGGGFGRLGQAIAPHVRRLVSVDADPLMKAVGPIVSPGIEFRDRHELSETPEFDGAYVVDGLRKVQPAAQHEVLEYVHKRLKPGGWLLVDVAPSAGAALATAGQGVPVEGFRTLCEPLFSVKRVPLFNAGFLLRKRAPEPDAPAPVDGRYVVNEASVVADVLEGEVVVVNLDNGSYYILQGTASTVWQMLAAGRSVAGVIEALSSRFPQDASRIETSIPEFVAQLTGEALLVPASSAAPPATRIDDTQLSVDRTSFEAPVMFRYSDMQALIQMDPIREYDETGWPVRPNASPAARQA